MKVYRAIRETIGRKVGDIPFEDIGRETDDGKVVYKVEAEAGDGREIELKVAEDGTRMETKVSNSKPVRYLYLLDGFANLVS